MGRADELLDQMRGQKSQASPAGRCACMPCRASCSGTWRAHLQALPGASTRGIALDLVVNDAIVDPVREGFDCALQIFQAACPTSWSRGRLFPVRRVFCASPDYLRAHGSAAPAERPARSPPRAGIRATRRASALGVPPGAARRWCST